MTPFHEIEAFFQGYDYESVPMPLHVSVCSKVFDLRLFVESSISILKANAGNKMALPYYERLETIYLQLKDKK